MAKKGLLGGTKVTKSHGTLIDEAVILINGLKQSPLVKKIVIGVITPAPIAARRVKISPVDAGFKVLVRGGGVVQTLFVYAAEKEAVSALIEKIWAEKVL